MRIRQLDDILLLAVKKLGHLLERRISRLNQLGPDEPALKHQEAAVHDVVAPLDVFDGDRIDKLVEEECAQDREAADNAAFRSQAVGQDLEVVCGGDASLEVL